MVENNRKPIASLNMFPQFTTMNVIDGQADIIIYSSLICYSLTIDNILNIIVLLILAGVTIATLTGDNGLLPKATTAKQKNEEAEICEQIKLAWNKVYTDRYLYSEIDTTKALAVELGIREEFVTQSEDGKKIKIRNYRGRNKILDLSDGTVSDQMTMSKAKTIESFDDNTAILDSYGNEFIVPKGFKISSDSAEIVTKGIVIEDVTYTNTIGSEFVWIPVSKDSTDENKVKGATKNATILLGRYVFDVNGNVDTTLSQSNPQEQLKLSESSSVYYTEGLKDSTTSVAQAIDIENFIKKTNEVGGFWIGRYEARTTSTIARNKNDSLTSVTEKPENAVYDWISQKSASIKSKDMYETNNYFESDLINSFAWDTATLFLQEYDDRIEENLKPYSRQTHLKTDKICNVYGMASGRVEWTTEMANNDQWGVCVMRGGASSRINDSTSSRISNYANVTYDSRGTFRPILYVK